MEENDSPRRSLSQWRIQGFWATPPVMTVIPCKAFPRRTVLSRVSAMPLQSPAHISTLL